MNEGPSPVARRWADREHAGGAVTVTAGLSLAGVGVDAVDVARFRGVLARRPGFAARYFSAAEQADAGRSTDPAQTLAARFAAKEALMKALGAGLGSFALTDVEVRRAATTTPTTTGAGPGAATSAATGAPSLVLHRGAAALARQHRAGPFHLSLTHTADVAIAFVVAERSPSCSPS